MMKFTRRVAIGAFAAAGLLASGTIGAIAAGKIKLRLVTAGSATDQRSLAMVEVFGPMVSSFVDYEPGYNGTLFAQGTELEAIDQPWQPGNVYRIRVGAGTVLPRVFNLRDRLCPSGCGPSGSGF